MGSILGEPEPFLALFKGLFGSFPVCDVVDDGKEIDRATDTDR